MSLFDAFDKRLHFAELADPIVTQEGVLAPSVRRARALKNLFAGALGVVSMGGAVLAAAGSIQSDSAVIATQVVVVTGADGVKGVQLPVALANDGPYYIHNDASGELLVYPKNGGSALINGLAANAAFHMDGGEFAVFIPTSATQWYVRTSVSKLTPRPTLRSTVTNAATITAAQLRGGVLYQDASGGVVTMTTRTAAQIVTDFPEMRIGDGIEIFMASNHATNTSTIAGGASVTLIGSGAVTQTGGMFKLIRTAAATHDLVRVG